MGVINNLLLVTYDLDLIRLFSDYIFKGRVDDYWLFELKDGSYILLDNHSHIVARELRNTEDAILYVKTFLGEEGKFVTPDKVRSMAEWDNVMKRR